MVVSAEMEQDLPSVIYGGHESFRNTALKCEKIMEIHTFSDKYTNVMTMLEFCINSEEIHDVEIVAEIFIKVLTIYRYRVLDKRMSQLNARKLRKLVSSYPLDIMVEFLRQFCNVIYEVPQSLKFLLQRQKHRQSCITLWNNEYSYIPPRQVITRSRIVTSNNSLHYIVKSKREVFTPPLGDVSFSGLCEVRTFHESPMLRISGSLSKKSTYMATKLQ